MSEATVLAPKVFLSHASEDKQRFVLPFATSLREKGIDVWLDKWEILPGDSLVDKLFEEGLKEAEAVLIVISAVSVTKPWVRQETQYSDRQPDHTTNEGHTGCTRQGGTPKSPTHSGLGTCTGPK
jgi:TIR domain